MKKLKEELKLFFYINNLPVFMVLLGLTLCYLFFNYHTFWSPFFYYFITGLFLFLPFFGRNKLPLARKMFTMIFGLIMFGLLLIYSIKQLDIIFLLAGVGGVLFFIKDYFVQRKHFQTIKLQVNNQGLKWANNQNNFKKYLNSKCSRQMFLRTISYLDINQSGFTETAHLITKKVFGYQWYHFFPDSNRPLIGIFFPETWRKIRKFLAKYKIKI